MWNPVKEIEKILPKKEYDIPEEYFSKCSNCQEMSAAVDVRINFYQCPHCQENLTINSTERIKLIADYGTFEEILRNEKINNPLIFKGYNSKVKNLQKKTGLDDALLVGKCKIGGISSILGVMDTRFLMGSMGVSMGNKLSDTFKVATKERLPVILYTASGGARMQEGIFSLMQMAKITNSLKKHSDAKLLYVTVLTNPTTGGVTASFASLGDIIIAEKNALICFAGPRVIKQTIKTELPEGFQRSEFLKEKGFIDKIVDRKDQRRFIKKILKLHQ